LSGRILLLVLGDFVDLDKVGYFSVDLMTTYCVCPFYRQLGWVAKKYPNGVGMAAPIIGVVDGAIYSIQMISQAAELAIKGIGNCVKGLETRSMTRLGFGIDQFVYAAVTSVVLIPVVCFKIAWITKKMLLGREEFIESELCRMEGLRHGDPSLIWMGLMRVRAPYAE
jgi:hypothetical protein